jgi:hypothetical protein
MKEFSKAMDAYNKALELDKDNRVRKLCYANHFNMNLYLISPLNFNSRKPRKAYNDVM